MTSQDKLAGKVAVITGAGSGIGQALAEHAASLGMKVVVAELSVERGESVVKGITAQGGDALFVQTNVADYDSVQALADKTFDHYGDTHLLVNNAGISVLGKIWEISKEQWDRAIDVNYRGAVYCIKAFTARMLEGTGQRYICNIGSLASFSIASTMSPYFNTKHAILSLSECLYIEMQEGNYPIHVCMAAPSMIKTRIFEDTVATQGAGEAEQAALQGVLTSQGLESSVAAEMIFNGIANKDFIISTEPLATQSLASQRSQYLADVHGKNPVPSDPGF
jgi:NAD(P)-dependent dehydrogenase (short-subunit alcohol dehydrogenase family)